MTSAQQADELLPADPEECAQIARAIALRRLAAAPRSVWEIEQALTDRGISVEVSGAVIERFLEVGLLDDEAFARAWVASRSGSRGLARARLRRELQAKGVDDGVIERAIAQVDDEAEFTRAMALAAQRMRVLQGSRFGVHDEGDESVEARDRAMLRRAGLHRRLSAYLMRRGYPAATAMQVSRAVVEAG